MQSEASGPSSCRIGESVCRDDSGRQSIAASHLSGYASEVHRFVNSSTFGSSVTPCASRGRPNPLDLSMRWGNTRSQSPAGQNSTQFATIDEGQYPMELNIGPRECRSSSFFSGEEKLLKIHREQKKRLLTEYEQLIQMYDKACAAVQQELQLLNLERAAKGSLEGRKFPEGGLENMSGTEPVRFGRGPHTQFPERAQERLFTGRSCHYLQDPRDMEAQQYTGYSGYTPQFYHNDEAPRFGVPFASPGRREPVMLSDVSPQRRKQKKPDKYDGEKVEWPDHLAHFETIAKWNGWSDGEKGLQLVTCLRGKAQRVLSEILSGQREDFATLSEFLARRFNPPNRETAFRFELRQCKKLAKESLMEYGGEVLRLTQKAYPNFPPEAIDQIATDQFV